MGQQAFSTESVAKLAEELTDTTSEKVADAATVELPKGTEE